MYERLLDKNVIPDAATIREHFGEESHEPTVTLGDKMKFPFNEPENVAVFTCVHILESGEDICYVTHDEDDGAWQFLCGQSHNESDARIVSLKNIFNIDNSIGVLSTMPEGCGAVRDNKAAQWKGFKK